MTRDTRRNVSAWPAPLLRWVLRRDTTAITCQLDARGPRAYKVCIVPHWDPSLAVIERYDAVAPALLRQAEVARWLRENG